MRVIKLDNSSTKRVKIVELESNKVIALRVYSFTTLNGNNSIGSGIIYNSFDIAVELERAWLNQKH